jgi:hypothetical protein
VAICLDPTSRDSRNVEAGKMLPLGDDGRMTRRRFRSLLFLVAFEGWSGSPGRGLVKKPPEQVKFLWDFTSRNSAQRLYIPRDLPPKNSASFYI